MGSDLEPRQRPRRRRSGTGSSGNFGWAFPNRWGVGGYKAPPLREGEGGVWGGVGFATAAGGCDGAVREPAAAAIRDGLSRTLVSINAYFEPANAKKKRFAACLLGVFHTFVYQKIGTN